MKLSTSSITALVAAYSTTVNAAAFISQQQPSTTRTTNIVTKGYLDDLNNELYAEDATPDVDQDKRENNQMSKDQLDRFGPGNLNQFVEFEEFDGGDGQMGVAGDGEAGLDKSDFNTGELASQTKFDTSKMRSAKNAWGTSTGYAAKLVDKGVDTARAQQLENWQNQQEIRKKNQEQKFMAEQFDKVNENAEADWRTLAKFGVERNQEFDLDESFGAVQASADLEGTIEFNTRPGDVSIHEIPLANPYMGFADFRAAFVAGTSSDWTIEPSEGSLKQREDTEFVVKFRPSSPGSSEGYLVIETEDFKKTWKLIGST